MSASAAVLLGALYGLGAAVEAARLALAQVTVIDGLALIPLPQLLTAGISLLLSTVLTFAGVYLFVAALYRLETFLKTESWRPLMARRRRAMRTKTVLLKHDVEVEKEEAQRLLTIRERVERFKEAASLGPKPPETRAALAEEGNRLVGEAEQHQTARNEALTRLRKLRRTARFFPYRLKAEARMWKAFVWLVKFGPLAIGVIASCLAPYPVGAALLIAGLAWFLATKAEIAYRRLGLPVLVSASVVVNGLIGVSPLPTAEVVTNSGEFRGPLISLTDATWYVGSPGGIIRPIPSDRVQSGVTRAVSVAPTKTLLQLVVSVL